MQIQIASPEDLEFIEGAYEHARAFMQANGNATQWPDGYRLFIVECGWRHLGLLR